MERVKRFFMGNHGDSWLNGEKLLVVRSRHGPKALAWWPEQFSASLPWFGGE